MIRELSGKLETVSKNGKTIGAPGGTQGHLFFERNGVSSESPELYLPVERFEFSQDRKRIIRFVRRRNGTEVSSDVPVVREADRQMSQEDLAADFDYSWLRCTEPPSPSSQGKTIYIADLFSGCGGMTLGIAEACRALGKNAHAVCAIDINAKALSVFKHNFPEVDAISDPIETLLDSDLGAKRSKAERRFKKKTGRIDILVGGPPCQGHSSLNNRTRRSDPKNILFLKMARFAEILKPKHIIIENVIGVQHDNKNVFTTTYNYLRRLGYKVTPLLLAAEKFGIAQTRKRVFLVATRREQLPDRDRLAILYGKRERTFRWACGDLFGIEPQTEFDKPSTTKTITQERIDYLFDHDLYDLPDEMRPECHKSKKHTYQSVYGRIRWDLPSPTITTGFTTMGQGRFVHPERRTTITPHEAARVQFFPDYFDFLDLNREAHKEIIGNAVPPKLTYIIGLELLR